MKAHIGLAFLSLAALAACQPFQTVSGIITAANALSGATVVQKDLDLAVQAYDLAIMAPLNTYRYSDAKHTIPRPYCTASKPFSATNFCASYDVLATIRPYTDKVEVATRDVQACIKTKCDRMQVLAAAFRAAWADTEVVKAQLSSQLGAIK